MSDLWKCPKCGSILRKGMAGMIAPGANIVGTATCGSCGGRFQQSDVYGGKYDISMDGGGQTKSCFVASAVYGSPDAPQVAVLRDWRDSYLRSFLTGRLGIRAYYVIGPGLAYLVRHGWLPTAPVRYLLDCFVGKLASSQSTYGTQLQVSNEQKGDDHGERNSSRS